jgi:hypothetical protein
MIGGPSSFLGFARRAVIRSRTLIRQHQTKAHVMHTTDVHTPDPIAVGVADLEAMVGPDPHRPGPARWRLLVEQMPVWAVVGHLGAIAGTTDPDAIAPESIAEVARERDIPVAAVLAALHYYRGNRGAVDALLAANAAALV